MVGNGGGMELWLPASDAFGGCFDCYYFVLFQYYVKKNS